MQAKANHLARYIDHTLLKPDATAEDIGRICGEAIENSFFAVCVPPHYVSLSKQKLKNSNVKVATVVGFPTGYSTPETKAKETEIAISHGADEIDMVCNIAAVKSADWGLVEKDIAAVVKAAKGKLVKVILETSMLDNDEKVRVCTCAEDAGANFVKTSTGFGGGGATVEDVQLMRASINEKMSVKASGGIRDTASAEALIKAGATRLGTSQGVAIVRGQETKSNAY